MLELQAIAESEQDIQIGPDETFHRKIGDVLHPVREPLAVLEAMKATMGTLDFSAQYQQRPVPIAGDMIKRTWLKFYNVKPAQKPGDMFVISWDTANKASELANYSVGTVWLVQDGNCYLLELVRGQYDFPALKRAVHDLNVRWPGATSLVEDKGSGISLIQELRAAAVPVIAINPEVDKQTRLYSVQPMFEAGSVHELFRSRPPGCRTCWKSCWHSRIFAVTIRSIQYRKH